MEREETEMEDPALTRPERVTAIQIIFVQSDGHGRSDGTRTLGPLFAIDRAEVEAAETGLSVNGDG
jgi:hypothetical protein